MNYHKLRQELIRIRDKKRWTIKEPLAYDHIRIKDGFFYHHGIYKSDSEVYHMTYEDGDIFGHKGYFEICTLEEFQRNQKIDVRLYSTEEKAKLLNHAEIDNRLSDILGKVYYDLLLSNCEHYINHITLNKFVSYQVQQLINEPITAKDNKGINQILGSVFNMIK